MTWLAAEVPGTGPWLLVPAPVDPTLPLPELLAALARQPDFAAALPEGSLLRVLRRGAATLTSDGVATPPAGAVATWVEDVVVVGPVHLELPGVGVLTLTAGHPVPVVVEDPTVGEPAADTVPGLISSVGERFTGPRPPRVTESVSAAPAAFAEETVARRGEAVEATRVRPPGMQVQAVLCPQGHPNPVQQVRCRRCGADVPLQDPRWLARPVLGRLRLLPDGKGAGGQWDLDRSFVVGREPAVTGEPEIAPHVVTLADPGLSRTHLVIDLDGWYVTVTDPGTTNGSTITHPGRSPQRLRVHEPEVLEPGALVQLGPQITFVYEVEP